MNLSYEAMMFAREAHKNQVRKYTGNPYVDHLAEVAGIVATVAGQARESVSIEEMLAVAWLHDCVEDQGVTFEEIDARFGNMVAIGVSGLSDIEVGNRAERKRMSCERLATCSGWIQTIKCADLISNTSSIVKHDPDFAKVYLREKCDLLSVMTKADRRLWDIAAGLAKGADHG
jgi:(p)ppGpp synthase/HD superfamily hydrolase